MKAGTPWPWDDGNELPRVIQAIKGQGFLYIFVPSPIFVSCTEITQSPISVCQYADNLSWVHGVLRVLYINVSKFPRHVTAVVKVIEYISNAPSSQSFRIHVGFMFPHFVSFVALCPGGQSSPSNLSA